MAYEIGFLPAAMRDVRKLSTAVRKPIIEVIEGLAADPRPLGCNKVVGVEGIYRIRWRDYRILYKVEDAILSVLVIRVRHRSVVYRRRLNRYIRKEPKLVKKMSAVIELTRIEDARIN